MNTAFSETVNNRVRELRTARNLTQSDLADALGITRQTVIAIEKGSYTPSVLLALKLAGYFNTSVEELFYYE
ncbi:MAG: anaerobic benzoate catabolism transcriptional regulator [candidate division WS6 bacterium OLB20]|uniref:Anaerobic benzoate catabolism transcriptional regulator n=1 Tax=candidate division WS6 bacterium OLB20 TaxID=1617426 RepID=A0A136LWQ1_9BACT|nr:MAG: anaerobic benzoate catabolism transcriptional regulator [candidate division WS6 bacterium OLB20]